MVVSLLNNNITYPENVDVEPNDIGQKLEMFQLEILNQLITVVIGTHVSFYKDKNVIFYPLYLVSKKQESIKMGVFEILLFDYSQLKGNETAQVDTAIQMFFTEPLLFSFVTNDFLEKYAHREAAIVPLKQVTKPIVIENKNKNKVKNNNTDVIAPSKYIIPKQVEKILEYDKELSNDLLPMETADDIAKKYVELKSPIWIQQLLQNNGFNIVQNEKKMCILTILVTMFQQNGYITDEQKIKDFIANRINEQVYNQYKESYANYTRQLVEKTKIFALIKKSLKNVGGEFVKLRTHEEKEKMYPQLKQLETDQNVLANDVKYFREQLICVQFMEKINSVDELRQYIVSNNCYCDEWILQFLERSFNIQFIIVNNITNLGTRVSTKVDKKTNFNQDELFKIIKFRKRNEEYNSTTVTPFFYVILEQIDNSFYPIRYYKKGFLQFQELPSDLKMLLHQSVHEESVYAKNTSLTKMNVNVTTMAPIENDKAKQSLLSELSRYQLNKKTDLGYILQFRKKEMFQYQSRDFMRYNINTDGHCLFDTISFLYLFNKESGTSCHMEQLGWVPNVYSVKNTVFAKGNLMDIIVNHRQTISEKAGLKEDNPRELNIIDEWLNMYTEKYFNQKDGISDETDYPSTEMIAWLFPSIFDILQYRFCTFTHFDSELVLTPTYPIHAINCNNDESSMKTIYSFNNSGIHFEPVTEM